MGTKISSNRPIKKNLCKKAENPRPGMMFTARYPIIVDVVRDTVGRSLKNSLLRLCYELGLSPASLQKILKKDHQLYPCRIQIKNKLTTADMEFLVSVENLYHITRLHLFEKPCMYNLKEV